jgi:hypothetical protein
MIIIWEENGEGRKEKGGEGNDGWMMLIVLIVIAVIL